MATQGTALAPVEAVIAAPEMRAKIKQALMIGVDEERFVRTALTAIAGNPSLLECDRASLYTAVIRAAQDGLLPDGREGAFVPFKNKDGSAKRVQWMPMIYGLRKRLMKCGIILEAHVIHANDEFRVELGDEPKIVHVPAFGKDRGEMIGAYAIATTLEGQKMREVMDASQIEAVRKQSKAADSLMWTQFKSEAWRKTVARRLCKAIPALDDSVQDMFKRDDAETFDYSESGPIPVPGSQPPGASPPRRPRALQRVVDADKPKQPTEPTEQNPPPATEYEQEF